MASSSTLFRPAMLQQAVAILLLIENSQAMSIVWSDLRDLYLPTLVDSLKGVNPSVPITSLVLSSLPPPDTQDSASSIPPQCGGLYDPLQDLRFNYDPSNKLSTGRISNGIDLLASSKFQGRPATRHLIVVAASTPLEDTNGSEFGPPQPSPWHLLAQKLAQADIHCHMVLNANENMTPFMTLFDETLRLQNNIQIDPWFPMKSEEFLFRLSARPGHQLDSNTGLVPYVDAPPRPGAFLQRNYSFPPDTYTMNKSIDETMESAPQPSQPDSAPSLVSQLQQVHGLTKKKVYTTKLGRQPFIREERVHDKHHRAPTPLAMPSYSSSTSQILQAPNRNVRASSRSRVDRSLRAGQASPTDVHSRRTSRWSRRGSLLGSPDPEGVGSVSTFSSTSPTQPSSDMSSPVSPTMSAMPVDDTYNMQPGIQPAGAIPLIPGHAGISAEPSWLRQQYATPPLSPSSQFSEASSQSSMFPIFPVSQMPSAMVDTDPMNHNMVGIQPLAYSDNVSLSPLARTGPNMNQAFLPKTNRSTSRTDVNPQLPTTSRLPSSPQSDNDEPFTFGDDYVAETAALFTREVLPSYPNFPAVSPLTDPARTAPSSDLPPLHDGLRLSQERRILPPLSTLAFGAEQTYGGNTRQSFSPEFFTGSGPKDSTSSSSSSSFPAGGSYSLRGWEG